MLFGKTLTKAVIGCGLELTATNYFNYEIWTFW